MKRTIIIFTIILIVPVFVIAQNTSDNAESKVNALIGNWKIDLRPTPEADEYSQPFEVKSINGNSFSGTFYGSAIKNALINKNWPKIYFAFSTSDMNNEYYHSGYLENGKLYGITYCPSREFTAPWTGTKN